MDCQTPVPLDTCTDQYCFSSFKPLENNSMVTLQNHSSIPVQFHGDVQLSDELTLRDVQYVPNFKFNLLSVSALIVHSNLAILFSHDAFVIQDISSQIMIGNMFKKSAEFGTTRSIRYRLRPNRIDTDTRYETSIELV